MVQLGGCYEAEDGVLRGVQVHGCGCEPRWTGEVVTRANREAGCRILEPELHRREEVAVKVDELGLKVIIIHGRKLSNLLAMKLVGVDVMHPDAM